MMLHYNTLTFKKELLQGHLYGQKNTPAPSTSCKGEEIRGVI